MVVMRGVSSLLMAVLIFVVTRPAASAVDVVDPKATTSEECSTNRIELDIGDLMSNINVTLKGLESLLGPLSEEEGVYVASLDGTSAQNHLVGVLVRKMEAENNQLKERIKELEVEKSRFSDRVIEWNKEYVTTDDQKQKTEIPCYSLKWPRDCQDLFHQGKNVSGIYTIYPNKCGFVGKGLRVWCDMDGEDGGWTTILLRRKLDQQVDFNQGWRYYRLGFGDPETEYWIGNDFLHKMTSERIQKLRIDMTDWNEKKVYAEYSSFMVDNADGEYRLHVGGHSGTAGDSLTYHNTMLFSTPDRDNDKHASVNCAADRKSGFWFNACEHTGPTNPILPSAVTEKGLHWHHWYNNRQTLKAMTFKIKPITCLV
ncbi:techylectin-5B-like [Palaemon carinicauda]|uniref:techylectin-5B-like n=1 Tax=Palaemon carinicauda TaxID=392227 RepID=UPI0035B68CDE